MSRKQQSYSCLALRLRSRQGTVHRTKKGLRESAEALSDYV